VNHAYHQTLFSAVKMPPYHRLGSLATIIIGILSGLHLQRTCAFVHTVADGLMAANLHRELLNPHILTTALHAGQHSNSMHLYFLTPSSSPFFPKEVVSGIEKIVIDDVKSAFDTIKNTMVPKKVEGTVASSLAESVAVGAKFASARLGASMLGIAGRYSYGAKISNPSSLVNFKSIAADGKRTNFSFTNYSMKNNRS
jgi:hypothetical protein